MPSISIHLYNFQLVSAVAVVELAVDCDVDTTDAEDVDCVEMLDAEDVDFVEMLDAEDVDCVDMLDVEDVDCVDPRDAEEVDCVDMLDADVDTFEDVDKVSLKSSINH